MLAGTPAAPNKSTTKKRYRPATLALNDIHLIFVALIPAFIHVALLHFQKAKGRGAIARTSARAYGEATAAEEGMSIALSSLLTSTLSFFEYMYKSLISRH
jgi:hypothetical protein